MNKKILGLLAAGLLVGPMSAQALTSTCVDDDGEVTCELYESDGTFSLQLDFYVEEGTVGIFETGQSSVFRNLLRFEDNDLFGGTLLTFWFGGVLPASPFDVEIERTGDLTEWLPDPNVFRVHHDFRAAVPEPGSLALLGLGLVGLGLVRRRISK